MLKKPINVNTFQRFVTELVLPPHLAKETQRRQTNATSQKKSQHPKISIIFIIILTDSAEPEQQKEQQSRRLHVFCHLPCAGPVASRGADGK